MLIETERLIIRELTADMVQGIHENSLDDNNRRFVPDEVFETVEEAAEVVVYLIEQYNAEDGPLLYPVLTKAGEQIGYVQLCPIEEGWEIGYHIAARFTGKGYATEAVTAFLPVIAAAKGIGEVYGICLQENAASIRVLEKCGFEKLYAGMGCYQGAERAIVKMQWRLLQG